MKRIAPLEPLEAHDVRRLLVSEPYDGSPEQRALIRRTLALPLDGSEAAPALPGQRRS